MPIGAAPQSVISLGGRFGYQDQGQTPNTQLTAFDFGNVKLLCEQRGLVGRKATKVTVEFYTSEGVVKAGKFFPKGRKDGEPIDGAPVGGFAHLGRRHPFRFDRLQTCIYRRRQGPDIIRHRARRVLVVCPAGLQVQWRDQMRDKFGLDEITYSYDLTTSSASIAVGSGNHPITVLESGGNAVISFE